MQDLKKNVILTFASFTLAIILTILVDRAVGWFLPHISLIFPPNTIVTYKTTEFEFTAHTNNLGLRGIDIDLSDSQNKFRIMTIGDSFTYGWGVNEEFIWSTIIAESLNGKGCPAEVINLGWPGKGPTEYADIAEKAIPITKPDLVIVSILQGDDLQQVKPSLISRQNMRRIFRIVYPNLSILVLHSQQLTSQNLQTTWQHDAKNVVNKMNQAELNRLRILDSEIQKLFLDGLLNPQLVFLGIHNPNYFLDMIDITNPQTQTKVRNLAFELGRIKQVSLDNNAEVIVIAIPYGIYVNERYLESSKRLGFNVKSNMLLSTAPDEAIESAAKKMGIQFISVLHDFRQNSRHLFYDLDAHFTIAGNELLAEKLLPIVENSIISSKTYKCTPN